MRTKYTSPVFLVWAALATPAMAQSPVPLSASELSNTVVGKKVEHMRLSDKRIFIWDVRDSGALYIQSSTLKGKWSLSDKGEFCVKWEAAQVPDQCYFFYHANGLQAGPTSKPGQLTSQVKSVK